MSSFLTDLPLKNSFIAIQYHNTEMSSPSNSLSQSKCRTSILNNPYITLHTNPNAMSDLKREPFLSKTTRFEKLPIDKVLNPGPGAYEMPQTMTTINSSSVSSKGYGVGFVSKEERFATRKLEKEKYCPGPGEYNHEMFNSMQHSVKTSLQGQSLYTSKVTSTLKREDIFPGFWSYNPMKTQEHPDYLHGPSFHKLRAKRFDVRANNIPGPGTYTESSDWERLNAKKKISFFFRTPGRDKEDFLKKYHIKTEMSKEDSAFRLKQNKKDGQLLKGKINSLSVNPKDKLLLHIGRNPSKGNEEYEYELNSEKKDLFALAAPRWKKNLHHSNIPGPAFYCPKLPLNKLSFNSNPNTFLYSPGVLFSSTTPFPLR